MFANGQIQNPTDLFQFVNNVLGTSMDPVIFNSLLQASQMYRESQREWRQLIKKDSSKTVTAISPTAFLVPIAMPTDRLAYINSSPIKLVDSLTNPQVIYYYDEVPKEKAEEFKDDFNSFYVDENGGNFYLCGPIPTTLSVIQYYIYKPATIFYDASTQNNAGNVNWLSGWIQFLPMLGYDICARQRLGVDYDDQNARMGDENAQRAEQIFNVMVMQDSRLAKKAVQNMDPVELASGNYRNRAIDIRG